MEVRRWVSLNQSLPYCQSFFFLFLSISLSFPLSLLLLSFSVFLSLKKVDVSIENSRFCTSISLFQVVWQFALNTSQTDRYTDRQTDKKTDRQMARQTKRVRVQSVEFSFVRLSVCIPIYLFILVCLLEKTMTIQDFHDFGFIGALFDSLAAP